MATKYPCRGTWKVLKVWMVCILAFLPLTMAITSNVTDDDLEITNLLNKFNKPYVKSIQSPDGDIIDCVPFHLQPAFDNPLNQNVTFEMLRARVLRQRFFGNYSSSIKPVAQLWHTNGRCPEGTVPIRRKTKEDIILAKANKCSGKRKPGTYPNPDSPSYGQTNAFAHEYAIRTAPVGRYHGGSALVGVWNPRVEVPAEFSLAQLWVYAGTSTPNLNTIEAGWQVYPQLYRDTRTRLFGFWTKDNYRTCCYNLDCNAFVQFSNSITLGGVISPISSYGVVQREIAMFIYKESIAGDWWLAVGGERIGYWPSHLFTLLKDGPATGIDWGGEVTNSAPNGRHTSTAMGSGAFPPESYKKAADFSHLRVLNQTDSLVIATGLQTRVTNPRCYDLRSRKADIPGEMFYYGGPGRNPDCP